MQSSQLKSAQLQVSQDKVDLPYFLGFGKL